MNAYEATRAAQIEANKALLANLGLAKVTVKHESTDDGDIKPPKSKKARLLKPKIEPSRRSNRLVEGVSLAHASLPDDFSDSEINASRRRVKSNLGSLAIRQLPAPDFPEEEIEADLNYDPDYRAALPTRDKGNSGFGILRFSQSPHFRPNLTPQEMMRLGRFGGTYFRQFYSTVCRKAMDDDYQEFPEEWYEGLDVSKYLVNQEYDAEINQYGVKASQSIEEWERAGWILKQDPRGWMQWYCRFYLGRRTPDDDRQIRRHLSAVGPRGRFKTGLVKKIAAAGGVEEWDNPDIAPILRQTLQHWGVRITRENMVEYLG